MVNEMIVTMINIEKIQFHGIGGLVTLAAVSVKKLFLPFFINLRCWFKHHSTTAQSYRDSATWSAAIPKIVKSPLRIHS
jgi:hypothetical protein